MSAPVAESSAGGRVVQFTLPAPTPLLNRTIGKNYHAAKAAKRKMAFAILAACDNRRPAEPFQRAHIRVERHSIGTPDYDGLVGGMKSLLDCLTLPGKPRFQGSKVVVSHPYGLGFIVDDAPTFITLEPVAVRARKRVDQKTVVIIREII
jgi:hypothetical protein